MASRSPWNQQAPADRPDFPHPTRRGNGEQTGALASPPFRPEQLSPTPTFPGGHATRSAASTARSTGTPLAFEERSQGCPHAASLAHGR